MANYRILIADDTRANFSQKGAVGGGLEGWLARLEGLKNKKKRYEGTFPAGFNCLEWIWVVLVPYLLLLKYPKKS